MRKLAQCGQHSVPCDSTLNKFYCITQNLDYFGVVSDKAILDFTASIALACRLLANKVTLSELSKEVYLVYIG
jgi:hypothetical protein